MRIVLVLLALMALAPLAQAHGTVNAGELEILFLQDEASDFVTGASLGYDVVQVYIGEAHLPALGDGLYVHTILYGAPEGRPLLDGEHSIEFSFSTDNGSFVRTLATTDGTTFTSDFDDLQFEVGDGEVEIQRAFIAYPDGIGPGTTLQSLVVVSRVGGEDRDVAPGGVFLPGSQGLVEVPMGDSSQVVPSIPLRGPIGYIEAKLEADGTAFRITAHNPLKEGDQHVLLGLPDSLNGWSINVNDGGEVKAGQNYTFTLRASPGSGPLDFDLLTDIGGRIPLQLAKDGDRIVLSSPAQQANVAPVNVAQESPLGLWLALAAVGVALVTRRAQR